MLYNNIMIKRRKTKQIQIGNVQIGSDAPISVQSMCNTDTRDVQATISQIKALTDAGCELVRLAVLNKDAASAIKEIKKLSPIPLIADIHFDYRLAIQCIENGIDALRLNPGNIGKEENVKKVIALAKTNKTPIRIGINAGSLQKDLEENTQLTLAQKMVESAMRHIKILEDNDFDLMKISLKSSSVLTTLEAYNLIAQKIDYPLHVGVTEAGTLKAGLIKSGVGIGALLSQGIGDTIRISLTENPVEEVDAGFSILKSLELRQRGINFVSCPTCGRCQIDLIGLAKKVENALKNIDKPLTVAVMGCPVNGPGEAKHADYGVAGAIKEGYIFKKGEIIKRVPEEDILTELMFLIQQEN